MQKLFSTLTNTYRTFKLLSNPKVGELLSKELQKEIVTHQIEHPTGETFHHRYYAVQVV